MTWWYVSIIPEEEWDLDKGRYRYWFRADNVQAALEKVWVPDGYKIAYMEQRERPGQGPIWDGCRPTSNP